MSALGENVQQILGWLLIIFPGILYIGQVISSVNFPLAQRLGLQEHPKETDPLLQRAERYTAYWDLITLGWLPISGILIVTNNSAWPLVSLFSGAIYLDASGREAAKNLSFKHEGLKIGTLKQQRIFFLTYLIMAIISIIVIINAVLAIKNGFYFR